MTEDEFYNRVSEFAKAHNMTCKMEPFALPSIAGHYTLSVSYKFSEPPFVIHRSERYHIRKVKGGKVNYWTEDIHDGRKHISGPGYRGSSDEQAPVPLDVICARFLGALEQASRYYEPI